MNSRLDVLYIHHASVYGGASRSLMEMIAAFPEDAVCAHVVLPKGPVADMLRQAGIEVLETTGIAQFDCTRYGYYRGMRWLILLREALYLPATIRALAAARRRWPQIDLIHVNDTTQAACIALAGRMLRAPVVVHARALLAGSITPRRTRWLGRLLTKYAQAVVAIDDNVRATLPPDVQARVIRNGYAPGLGGKLPAPKSFEKFSTTSLKIAMVGSLSPMKGAYEFVEAARILVAKGLDVDFVLLGNDIRPLAGLRGWLLRRLGFGRPVRRELEASIAAHRLQHRVHLLGFTTEIKAVYDAIDILCFPSHLDAPGRPVFEAAFSGVPSIVAVRNPTSDTLIDGQTGVCIPARDPGALADAIEWLYHDRSALKRMGEAARVLALRNFDIRRNAAEMLALYRTLVEPTYPEP